MGNLGATAQAYSKYDVVSYVAGQDATKARDARNLNPSMRLHFQICAREYQGEKRSMGFRSTGPNTDTRGMMFAGHWLYKKGTRLTSDVNPSTDTLYVDSTAEFTGPKAYIVIYDAGTNFTNAEHVRITSVGTNYLRVERGYKSTAVAHAGGSIIAEQCLRDAKGGLTDDNSIVWSYNHATTCPKDADGKTAGERNAEWISTNYNVNQNGDIVSGLNPAGVQFDSDLSYPGSDADVNNDLVADGGKLNGKNVWLEGYQLFYANMREIPEFENKSLVGGVPDAMGFAANGLSGNQMEDWPYFFKNKTDTDYEANFSDYLTHAYYHPAPSPYTECLYKHGTPLYTSIGATYSWQEFRFALGSALLADGYFGQKAEDPWYEEYSVDPATGRADPLSTPPQHKHWMGKALEKFERIYDATAFESNDAVLKQTGRMTALSGNYTLCFTASTPKTEMVNFGLGYAGRNILVPTSPKKFVFTFYNQTGTKDIEISGGGVSVSDVYLFEGTADLLRRDFEKAVVFVNFGNESKRVVVPAGERLMRIQGNGGVLDPVNNGEVYDGNESDFFDLPAKDAAILVRLSSVPAGPPRAPRGLKVE